MVQEDQMLSIAMFKRHRTTTTTTKNRCCRFEIWFGNLNCVHAGRYTMTSTKTLLAHKWWKECSLFLCILNLLESARSQLKYSKTFTYVMHMHMHINVTAPLSLHQTKCWLSD